MTSAAASVEAVFREEHGRAVAALTRLLGDLSLAEEAVADAFTVAVERWREDGPPPNPGGWIVTTAKRRAIDRLRRESYGAALARHEAAGCATRVGPLTASTAAATTEAAAASANATP